MPRFSLGVFVDAHHLVGVEQRTRDAADLLERLQLAAEQMCMASGVAHRVVVADCSDPEARSIAEDFGEHGFRMRHVPRAGGGTAGRVLAAEVFEALAGQPDLLTVAVVAGQETHLPLAEPLHRTGRMLIVCSAGPADFRGCADHVIALPLGLSGLRTRVLEAVGVLRAEGVASADIAKLENVLRRDPAGYRAADYGVRTRDVLRSLSGAGFTFRHPDRIELHGEVAAVTPPPGHIPPQVVPDLCRSLAEVTGHDVDDVVGAVGAVLGAVAGSPVVRAAAEGPEGLKLAQVVAGVKIVTPAYKLSGVSTTDLFRRAAEGTDWTVWQNPDQPADVRLRLPSPPGGDGA
ncbi:hypothetical protein [Kitasatospora sp. NBC_01539]|jgi:hypothetical protein|uniref:hypothetical protein n=1 Tax=Kitasatospora sp. NBC_01539 TaxID=2903577 RepID=UPI0038600FFB